MLLICLIIFLCVLFLYLFHFISVPTLGLCDYILASLLNGKFNFYVSKCHGFA